MVDIEVLGQKADAAAAKIDSVIDGMSEDPKVSDLLDGQRIMQSGTEMITQLKQAQTVGQTINKTAIGSAQ